MNTIIFDVGANNGESFINVARKNPTTTIYAFEPVPEMISVIKSKTMGLENYTIVEAAVSDYNGRAIFNVAGHADWGCSSLLSLSEKSKTEWRGRTDMQVTHKILVDVIRLDTFVDQNNIPHIDYLHIDAQGSDLNVLVGLGQYLNKVKEGVMEAANKENILYKNQNKKEDCILFLEKKGFSITDISYNDGNKNEVNIFFKNTQELFSEYHEI